MNRFCMGAMVKVAFLFLFLAVFGCEDKASVSDVDGYFKDNGFDSSPSATPVVVDLDLVVDPAAVTVSSNGDQRAFTASGGTAPYTWSVLDISVGSIVAQGGTGAVYERTAPGDNTVQVVDSLGEIAFAVVSQP